MRIEPLIEPLWVVFVATLPISELRGAIPLAIAKFHLSPITAYFLAVIGNLIPVIPLLLYLPKITGLLSKVPVLDRLFQWLFAYTRRRHHQKFNKFGALALVLLVAIPFPATGAWTGSLAAYLFKVKFRYAFFLIFLGILIAGIIVTLANLGVISFLGWLKLGQTVS